MSDGDSSPSRRLNFAIGFVGQSGSNSSPPLVSTLEIDQFDEDDTTRKNKWDIKRNNNNNGGGGGGFSIPSLNESIVIPSIPSLQSLGTCIQPITTTTSQVVTKNYASAGSMPASGFKIPNNTNKVQPVTQTNKEYSEYLAKLQLRNREKKRLEDDPSKREREEKERGFSLNWSGANNQKKDKSTLKPTISNEDFSEPTTKIKIRSRPTGYAERNQQIKVEEKRGWKQSTISMKKENGERERIAPSDRNEKPNMFEGDDIDQDDDMLLFRKKTRVTLNKDDIEVLRKSLSSLDCPTEDHAHLTTMDTLIEKLKKLDQSKQQYLLQVLEQLEQSDKSVELDVSDDGESTPKSTQSSPHSRAIIDTDTYCLRILSTWGHSSNVGLTEIEFYSFDETKIEVTDEQVNLKGGLGGKGSIMRVFNGKKKTVNEQNMWQTSFPTLSYLEIFVTLPSSLPVTGIVIWNFNKSINESVKGVREIEILRNDEQVWKGSIQRGNGNNAFDFSTSIQIMNPEEMQSKRSLFKPPKVEVISPTVSPIPKKEPSQEPPTNSYSKMAQYDSEDSEDSSDDEVASSYSLEIEDDDDLLTFTDEKKSSPPNVVPPLSISNKKEETQPKIVEEPQKSPVLQQQQPPQDGPKEQKEPIWLSLSKQHQKTPKGNILSNALKNTNPEKIPVWFRELEKEPTQEKPRKVANIDLTEKHEEEAKESPKKEVMKSSRSRSSLDQKPPTNPIPEKVNEPTPTPIDSGVKQPSRSKSRPKRPQVIYNQSGYTDKSSITNETFDSLMKFKYSHLGRLKPRDQEESSTTNQEPTEIKPPVWKIERRRSSQKIISMDDNLITLPALALSKEKQQPEVVIEEEEDADFFIPIYPSGTKLTINIKESWGDPHYLGLSGIEIFDKMGNLVVLNDVKSQVRANPSDINSLPNISNDPRTIDKVFDGVNMTCDDFHQWLTPFTPGGDHFIYVTLNERTTISMLRFWNYNKSRIHSYRGAKYLEIFLDDKPIFKGEIKPSMGYLSSVEAGSESILFTTESDILEKIDRYDQEVYANLATTEPEVISNGVRPKTASKDGMDPSFNPIEHFSSMDPSERPLTSALPPKEQPLSNNNGLVIGQKIRIVLESSWGDLFYIGLTGIEVLGKDEKLIKVITEQLSAKPRDMNEVSGHSGDYRTLDKLVDGHNVTTDDRHMWMVPVTLFKERPYIEIDLRRETEISGLRFFNYNKNLEDTFRGVKKISIFIDDKPLLESDESCFILKKAPGNTNFDFGHTILFSDMTGSSSKRNSLENLTSKTKENSARGSSLRNSSLLNEGIQQAILKAQSMQNLPTPRQDYQTTLLPCAYTFKFHLISSHGDPYYVGLNGIELFDARHERIPLTASNIQASPFSVSKEDVRTPDKLLDGVNNTWNDGHMWLTLIEPGQDNYLYITFEEPIAVSFIKIWNYSKTTSRGVDELIVYADDVIIYKGFLRMAPAINDLNIDRKKDFAQSILFTNDPTICQREKKRIFSRTLDDQDVKYYNEKQLVKPATSTAIQQQPTPLYQTKPPSREFYPSTRPTTSVVNK